MLKLCTFKSWSAQSWSNYARLNPWSNHQSWIMIRSQSLYIIQLFIKSTIQIPLEHNDKSNATLKSTSVHCITCGYDMLNTFGSYGANGDEGRGIGMLWSRCSNTNTSPHCVRQLLSHNNSQLLGHTHSNNTQICRLCVRDKVLKFWLCTIKRISL